MEAAAAQTLVALLLMLHAHHQLMELVVEPQIHAVQERLVDIVLEHVAEAKLGHV